MENEMNIKESTMPFVYLLLMDSPIVKSEIQSIYFSDESKYKKEMKNIALDKIITSGTQVNLKWDYMIISSVLNVLEKETSTEEKEEYVLSLIKKSYKRIYDFAMNNNKFNLGLFTQYIDNREPNTQETTKSLYYALYLYLCSETIDINNAYPTITILLENLAISNLSISNLKTAFSLNDNEAKESLEFYQQLTGEKWRNNESKSLDIIFGLIELKALKDNPTIMRQITLTANSRMAYHLRPLAYNRHALSVIQSLGYDNSHIFHNIMINKDEWHNLYAVYKKDIYKKFNESERGMLMSYALIIFGMHKVYKKLEDLFWEISLSNDIQPILEASEKLVAEKKAFEKEYEALKIHEERIEKELKQKEEVFISEKDAMMKEIQRLKNENEKLTNENKLTKTLQTALFRSQELHESYYQENDSTPLEQVKSFLKDKKVVLIGGHDKFRKKLSKEIEGLYHISPDEKHVGEKQMKAADVIIFETSYNNHIQFERMKGLLKDQKVAFINNGYSMNRIGYELLEQFNAN